MMARGKKKESALTPEEKLAQALVPDWEQPYKVPRNWSWVRLGSIVVNHDAKRVPLSTAQRSTLDKIYEMLIGLTQQTTTSCNRPLYGTTVVR